MSDTRYSKSHEWVRVEGDTATVGITTYAAEQLGDVVYVELPAIGAVLARGKESAVVESVKAASEIYTPVSGTITAANQELVDAPALVNEDPTGKGWFFKLTVTDLGELSDLLDEAGYAAFVAEQH